MKLRTLVFLIAVASFTSLAYAQNQDAPVYGPYLSISKGGYKCSVLPSGVTVSHDGRQTAFLPLNLDAAELTKAISKALQDEAVFGSAQSRTETLPILAYNAGVTSLDAKKVVREFSLEIDSASIYKRMGPYSQSLLTLLQDACEAAKNIRKN